MTALTMSDAPKDLPRRCYMLSIHQEGIISNGQFDDVQKGSGAAISNSMRTVRPEEDAIRGKATDQQGQLDVD